MVTGAGTTAGPGPASGGPANEVSPSERHQRRAHAGEVVRLLGGTYAHDVPVVEVEGLVVRYGDVVAVDELSLTAGAGQVTAILGPNGAGKTSTVEVMEGYRRADSGSVRVGRPSTTAPVARAMASTAVVAAAPSNRTTMRSCTNSTDAVGSTA